MTARSVIILGSTGSIGTQALEVVTRHPHRFRVAALSAHSDRDSLFKQVREHRPEAAALTGGEAAIPDDLRFCQWYFGPQAIAEMTEDVACDDVLVAVTGMVGLSGVLAARRTGKRVLLANKEALVAGGQLVMDQCTVLGANPTLLPVDSEHSAIWQCLQGAGENPFQRLILTASGGPFRTWSAARIQSAGVEDALRHPNWEMGAKITVDSATMFNKALEVIEAKWLFDAQPQQIDVLVHPQSIVHSMVAFADGALLAQLGLPDMRVPIQYAMSYPERLDSGLPPVGVSSLHSLQFEEPDHKKFPSLRMAYDALKAGGNAACVLNAANEVAVEAFLAGKITFGDIFNMVDDVMNGVAQASVSSLEAVLTSDRLAREAARLAMNTLNR